MSISSISDETGNYLDYYITCLNLEQYHSYKVLESPAAPSEFISKLAFLSLSEQTNH